MVGTAYPPNRGVAPSLPDDAREKPHPELVVERCDGIATEGCRDPRQNARQRLPVEISRCAEDVRHGAEVDARPLRRFHVEAGLCVEARPADAAPVEPAAEDSPVVPGSRE